MVAQLSRLVRQVVFPQYLAMNVRIDSCTALDMRDCLREAKAAARRSLGCSRAVRPSKRAVSRIVADLLRVERGPHGAGFEAVAAPLGGVVWYLRCGGCGGRAGRLFRRVDDEPYTCRRCSGVAYPHWNRGWLAFARMPVLVAGMRAFDGRVGRRPKRFHRQLGQLRGVVAAGRNALS